MAHIERAFDQDLTNMQNLLATMAKKVQYMLDNSMKALLERDTSLAEEIIQFDKEVDDLELQIDQLIYEIIALRQPAASDLRTVLAAIKINNDLERMGDYCEGICRQAITLNKTVALKEAADLKKMSTLVSKMLGDAIKAYTDNDIQLAKQTILADDEVDEIAHAVFSGLQELMKKDPTKVEPASGMLLVISKLERIADQSTNICEEVVFSVTGDNIRHKSYIFAVGKKE